jgi:TPP-dependent pyruvate/acetoin dehydrogenase alpha subunit
MHESELESTKEFFPELTEMHAPEDWDGPRILDLYKTMRLIREFEATIPGLWKQNLITGLAHSSEGSEAIAAGACAALEPGDYITSTHRGHGHCIAKGGDVNLMMAELMGKVDGYCRGKGGSMHIAFVDGGMLGACGIVGGYVPFAVGCALRASVLGDKDVTICFHGDGGSNQGVWHEAINLASIWKLPVVFLIENNQNAISMTFDRAFNIERISDRGAAYGIPGVTVDGFNPFEVYTATKWAVDRARAGEGPSIVEAKFFRYVGHFVADDERYRTKDDTDPWRVLDPVSRLRDYMLDNDVVAEAELEEVEAVILAQIERAIAFGKNSPEPGPETLFEGLYAE